jgi:hypothetical protein
VKQQQMRFWILRLFLLIGVGALAARADSNSDAIDKLSRIPPADPKWEDTMNFSDPNAPSLILNQRGAFLNGSEKPIPFDQILTALATLPREAWGHGRFLIFVPFPPGIHSSEDVAPPDSVVKKVLAQLKTAGIRINRNIASA